MSLPLFEATDLVVRYHEVLALDRLSIAIQPGERVALLGANGSGKSTFLRVLDGLIFPESGTLTVDGERIVEARFAEREFTFQFRKRVGLVFQNPDIQLFNPTVFDEIAFGPLQLRWPKQHIRQRVDEVLEGMVVFCFLCKWRFPVLIICPLMLLASSFHLIGWAAAEQLRFDLPIAA